MKKIFSIFYILIFNVLVISAQDIVQSFSPMAEKLIDVDKIGKKPCYAFVTLKSDLGSAEVDEYITDALMEAVFQTGKIKIIERAKLENILKELNLQSTGIIDEKTAKKIGKIAGVDYICYGTFSEEGGMYYVKVKVTDVQSGELCALTSDYISPDEYISKLIKTKKEEKKQEEKVEKKLNKLSNPNNYFGLFCAYDILIPDCNKAYGVFVGCEKCFGVLNIGLDIEYYSLFSNPNQAESNYLKGYANIGFNYSLFHLFGGFGYGIDFSTNKNNTFLIHGIVGCDISIIRIDYKFEYLFLTQKVNNAVSIGLIKKF